MDAERERVYAEAHRHAAQSGTPPNQPSGYRARWSVDLVGLPPRDRERRRVERHTDSRPDGRERDRAKDREERTIDLVPLMRLAQEACWSRLVNRPRRVRPAEI